MNSAAQAPVPGAMVPLTIRPSDYFLPEAAPTDDLRFRAAARAGSTVTPIVDGHDAFQQMEKAIAAATTSVHLSLWIFNPHTPLQARAAVNDILRRRRAQSKVNTWGELLAAVAGLGAKVRVILADFDPVLQDRNHSNNWGAYFTMRALAAARAKSNLEVIVSMHDARTSFLSALYAADPLADLLTRINHGGTSSALQRVSTMPALWPYIKLDNTRKGLVSSNATITVRPAVHHQKLLVVDRVSAFCGGLDVNRGRIAAPGHATGTWHDADVHVDAQAAADLDRNFLTRWNREGPIFNAFIDTTDPTGRRLPATPVTVPITAPADTVPAGTGPAMAQVWRTVSQNGAGRVPDAVVTDIRDGTQHAIGLAEKFVYIENQYIRDGRIADWLIARRAQVPGLVVIMLLPVAPEEVTNKKDLVTKLGLFLQHALLLKLRDKFGANFGMFSAAQRSAASNNHLTNTAGSLQVYIHNKTIIVDDAWACVGSANANQRSFEVDTEVNVAWYDPSSVRNYRLQLWREILGSPTGIASWAPSDFVAKWSAIATANAARDTAATISGRQGLAVPHDPDRFPGASNVLIPNAFAELVDTVPDTEFFA